MIISTLVYFKDNMSIDEIIFKGGFAPNLNI